MKAVGGDHGLNPEFVEHSFVTSAPEAVSTAGDQADQQAATEGAEVVEPTEGAEVDEEAQQKEVDAALERAAAAAAAARRGRAAAGDRPPEPWMENPAADSGIPGLVAPSGSDKYHVLVTMNGGIYVTWQSRVCYYWYKRMKALYPDSAMGGFTRIIHGGVADEYMEEIPSVVVDPMPEDIAKLAQGYVVLERPLAFQQWVRRYAAQIPEPYILMSEPDHVFVLPPPLWATPTRPAAFAFFYIEPTRFASIINKFNPKNVPIDQFEPIGNSPVMIHKDQFASIVDLWVNTSLAIKADHEADKEFGWVQEMYAYSIASATADGGPIRYDLHKELMIQPPWDDRLSFEDGTHIYIIHFTYGNDFSEKGAFTPGKIGAWHFDKRDYMAYYPPSDFPQPPKGCNNTAVRRLISSIGEAARSLPDWDSKTAKVEVTDA
ncbi:hypothetical protein ACKKBG_A03835 [Auxenochlorella protothecoides x Auxenochlorella symbiontica]